MLTTLTSAMITINDVQDMYCLMIRDHRLDAIGESAETSTGEVRAWMPDEMCCSICG